MKLSKLSASRSRCELSASRSRRHLTAPPWHFPVNALRSGGNKSWLYSVLLAVTLLCAIAPRAAAQMDGSLSGNVLDVTGKPWVDMTVDAVSDQGAKLTAKTDKDGNYAFHNLRAGVFTLTIELPAPNKPHEFAQVHVASGAETAHINVNFKDVMSKQGSAAVEAQKKQEEDKQKFQG